MLGIRHGMELLLSLFSSDLLLLLLFFGSWFAEGGFSLEGGSPKVFQGGLVQDWVFSQTDRLAVQYLLMACHLNQRDATTSEATWHLAPHLASSEG